MKVPERISRHRQAWLWQPIFQRMHRQNKMFSLVIVGEPGSGKSWLGLSICRLLDPTFGVDRVCFTAVDFLKTISGDLPRGNAVLVDDAGLVMFSRESMTKVAKQLSKVFQSCRFKNLCIVLTLPNLNLLDKSVRELLNAYAEPLEIDFNARRTRAKFQHLQCNPKTAKIYAKRPEKIVWETHADGFPIRRFKRLNSIWVDAPPRHLSKEYEAAKKRFLKQWYSDNYAKLLNEAMPKENLFAKFYGIVSADKKEYLVKKPSGLVVDPSKIVLKHNCSMYVAIQVARAVNREA